MTLIAPKLMPGERLIYLTRRHFVFTVARPFAIALACAVVGAFFFHVGARIAGWVFFAFALIAVAQGVIVHLSSEFFVTNRRLMIKTGIVTTKSWEFLLSKIEGIHIEQSLLGRLHGFGSIIVTRTGGSRDVFDGVAHPFEFRQAIHEQIERRSRPTARSDESGSE